MLLRRQDFVCRCPGIKIDRKCLYKEEARCRHRPEGEADQSGEKKARKARTGHRLRERTEKNEKSAVFQTLYIIIAGTGKGSD